MRIKPSNNKELKDNKFIWLFDDRACVCFIKKSEPNDINQGNLSLFFFLCLFWRQRENFFVIIFVLIGT